jgi:uncharacterized protein YpiB (UPF0302 family)
MCKVKDINKYKFKKREKVKVIKYIISRGYKTLTLIKYKDVNKRKIK